jgi:Icc-related predicted phosphoesterase
MIKHFNDLAPKEQEILLDAPLWVAIWVGISDNHFDKKEQAKALETLGVKSFSESPDVAILYQQIQHPGDRLTTLLDTLPASPDAIKEAVKNQLLEVKAVLGKCDPPFAMELFKSFRSVGVHVANASGGMLGIGSMSEEERTAMQLEFLKP